MAKLLLARGANPEIKDNQGRTALTIAQENKHDDIVELLLNATKGDLANPPVVTRAY